VLTLAAAGVLAGDPGKGAMIYNQHCIGCHGPGGRAMLPNAPSFANADRLAQPDLMLLNSIKAGKAPMPPFIGILKDQQILDVIAYIRTLPVKR
jgi:cytochrome c6